MLIWGGAQEQEFPFLRSSLLPRPLRVQACRILFASECLHTALRYRVVLPSHSAGETVPTERVVSSYLLGHLGHSMVSLAHLPRKIGFSDFCL